MIASMTLGVINGGHTMIVPFSSASGDVRHERPAVNVRRFDGGVDVSRWDRRELFGDHLQQPGPPNARPGLFRCA
jgi:hypothetical protein